jgi:ribokinase
MGTVGGDVFYSGLGAALWGERVGLWSRVGDDFPAVHLEMLERAGLDTDGIRRLPGSTLRYWVLYEWDGRRHFIYRTPEERFYILSPEPKELPRHYADQARAVHVAALPFDNTALAVRHASTLPGKPLVTLDTHEDFVAGFQDRIAALLPMVTAFLPSREEVASWFGDDDPARYIVDLLAFGPESVVIKMGADGALLRSRGMRQTVLVPPVPVTVRDVTGAGDAFCGGFVARLTQTGDCLEAALGGAVAASFAVESHGSLALVGVDPEERDRRLAALRPSIGEKLH